MTEREMYEAWLGVKPSGHAQDVFGWECWKARAATPCTGDVRADVRAAESWSKATMKIRALTIALQNCVGHMETVAMECGEDDTPQNFALAISRAHEVLK
jgi:hypothetical protein